MTGKLAGLVVPQVESLGYPQGWGKGVVTRIGQEMPDDVGPLVLNQRAIDDVCNCSGLWQGKELVTPVPANAFDLRRQLVVRVVKEWVEYAKVWGQTKPIDFVREFLGTERNFDPLTATMLFLFSEFERIELENELAMAIAHIAEAWPAILDSTQCTLGPVVKSLSINGVVLSVDTVDVTFGDHHLGVEVNWPGSVLVRFVASNPSPSDLEEMALAALVHGIATGCPPQRLVVYGIQGGRGLAMDVERDWLEMAIGGTRLAVKTIAGIRNDRGMVIDGGGHCAFCPYRNDCEASEARDASGADEADDDMF
jgi:hypothetical protein